MNRGGGGGGGYIHVCGNSQVSGFVCIRKLCGSVA